MEKIYQMEYRGLNLFDEISTVELAIDEENQTIHIFDVGQVVSPIFNFDVSAYELSDGFIKWLMFCDTKNLNESTIR